MKKINNYWVDENNNKWWCGNTTEEQAIAYSESLIACSNCYNCHDCNNCCYCRNCCYCYNCNDCRNCCYCANCSNCHDCNACRDCNDCCYCRYCRYCDNCNDCRNCHYCDNCYRCEYYTENPARYLTDRIGSRRDHTVFYFGKIENGMSLQVVCGCFRGDLKEFEAAVLKTHENSEVYRNQYLKEIAKVKTLFELEV